MGLSQFPAASGGLSTARFPIAIGAPFTVPAGITLRNTVTSTTTFSAGALPAQVWAVVVGAGGGGVSSSGGAGGGGGGVAIGWVDVPSAGITAVIGAGGAAGSAQSATRGGDSWFGTIAYGGGAGYYLVGNSSNAGTPSGPGAGCGGGAYNASGANIPTLIPYGNAPYLGLTGSIGDAGTSSTLNQIINQQARFNNYAGGGAGGNFVSGKVGSGLTGGGGETSTPTAGGNSSRDGGNSNTFTGGAGNSTSGGGGAGLLANGSAGSGATGGAGGSGGGGGGGGSSTGGSGGAGCVLIYY